MLASLVVRSVVMRRWLAGGMSAGRAAALSMAISWVPVLGFVAVSALLADRRGNVELSGLLVLALIALPVLWAGYGFRHAIFDYMERYGVRDHLNQEAQRRKNK
jgi:hypothetical protein